MNSWPLLFASASALWGDCDWLTEEGWQAVRTSAHQAGLRCMWGPAGYGYARDAWFDSWRPRRVPFTQVRVFSDAPAGRGR